MRLDNFLQQWSSLTGLLDEILEVPAAERPQWLADRTNISAEERAALANLLQFDGIARWVGDSPKFVPEAFSEGSGPQTGQLVGPYRLISPLGRGGMAVVWLAERADLQVRRRVALKLPLIGWDSGFTERIQRERDILAALEHPGIARLYDAGADDQGRPYLALEYVDGTPIDQYCASHDLDVRARLDLVLAVANAVSYAHTQLIVHRDLKPANILVTQKGEVRLLDFGIGKLLSPEPGAEDLTKMGGAATLDYASPEQLRGEPIGTPSDVYSLGVLTYELLTGTRPYRLEHAPAVQLSRALAAIDIKPASSVAPESRRKALQGDLDVILAKALEHDRAARYNTIGAFVDDIERHLSQRPISLRRKSSLYRFRKYVIRHRLPVAAASIAVIGILAGAGVALWQAHTARMEAARADLVKDFALSIFDGADSDSADSKGAATTAKDLLLIASRRADAELQSRPDVAIELMNGIAYSLIGQSQVEEAQTLINRTVARANTALGPEHPLTLAAKLIQAEALQDNDHSAEAAAVASQVIEPARRQKLLATYIGAEKQLASIQLDLGKKDAALVSIRQAVANLPKHADTRQWQTLSEETWQSLANTLSFMHLPGAIEPARRAMEIREKLDGNGKTEALFACRAEYASALATEGDQATGIRILEQTLSDEQAFLGPHHYRVQYAANFLGAAKAVAGDLEGALAAYKIEFEIEASDAKPGEDRTGISRWLMANVLGMMHRYDDALAEIDRSVALLSKTAGPNSETLIRPRSVRAFMLARLGRLDEADHEFAQLHKAGSSGFEGAMMMSREAYLRLQQGRLDAALDLSGRAAQELRQHVPVIAAADAYRIQGAALLAANRPADAERALQSAVDLYASRQLLPTPDRLDATELLRKAHTQVMADSTH